LIAPCAVAYWVVPSAPKCILHMLSLARGTRWRERDHSRNSSRNFPTRRAVRHFCSSVAGQMASSVGTVALIDFQPKFPESRIDFIAIPPPAWGDFSLMPFNLGASSPRLITGAPSWYGVSVRSGGLCFERVAPWQEIGDLFGGMVCNLGEDASQVGLGVKAIVLGGSDQRQYARGSFAAAV